MILALDTATRWTGLALHSGSAIIAEHGWQATNTQTVELAPAVSRMWQQANITVDDLKGIAVAIGPGSYTGLRVGLGFAKGLSLTTGLPIIGVSTLDILAAAVPKLTGSLVVVIEAGRSRVTAARYTWQGRSGWQAEEEAQILTFDELLAQQVALNPTGATTFVGEGVPEYGRQIRAAGKNFRVVPAAASLRRAGYLAEIGWQRLKRGQVDDAASLTPVYLRDPAGA